MNNYPEAVSKIVNDYLERLKAQLRLVPASAQKEFLLEIQSHVYEAYQEAVGEDDVDRILSVLRKLGEPAEVVSDRLPKTMTRSGRKLNLPLHIIGGVLVALFGIPLGFGGAAIVVGVLIALIGIVVSFYATAASMLLVATLLMVLGMTRVYQPELWDKLVMFGVIQMDAETAEFLDHLSPAAQGFIMLVFAMVLAAVGLGMLWLGKRFIRGMGFLFSLVFDWTRQLARSVRSVVRRRAQGLAEPSWGETRV